VCWWVAVLVGCKEETSRVRLGCEGEDETSGERSWIDI